MQNSRTVFWLLVGWYFGILVGWYVGILVFWYFGILVFWYFKQNTQNYIEI